MNTVKEYFYNYYYHHYYNVLVRYKVLEFAYDFTGALQVTPHLNERHVSDLTHHKPLNNDDNENIQVTCFSDTVDRRPPSVKFAAVYERFGQLPTDSGTQAVVAACVCLRKMSPSAKSDPWWQAFSS